jgi:hypothetical protein
VRASGDIPAVKQQLSSETNAPVSGNGLLFIRLTQPGDWVEIGLPGDIPPGEYEVYALAVTSWDYGICQWSLGGTALGAPFDGHSDVVGMKALPRAVVRIGQGPCMLRIEAVGKADRSTGCYAGVDAIVLRRTGS